MNTSIFETAVEMQLEKCKKILVEKGKDYAPGEDRLDNFKRAGAFQGVDPKQALSGMMSKHAVSIADMCTSGRDYALSRWDEKITDNINYLLLLSALVHERELENRSGDPLDHIQILPNGLVREL